VRCESESETPGAVWMSFVSMLRFDVEVDILAVAIRGVWVG
jgi:hypothetical protein